MKKNYFLLGLFVGLFLPTMSLGQEYEPFLIEGKTWKYDFNNNYGRQFMKSLVVRGDTTINDLAFKKIYDVSSDKYEFALREEGKKVYCKLPTKDAQLIYDFGKEAGEIVREIVDWDSKTVLRVLAVDAIKYGDRLLRRMEVVEEYIENDQVLESIEGVWIEGLGSSCYLVSPVQYIGNYYTFYSCKIGDEMLGENKLFFGVKAQECFPEGTKWTEIRLDTLKYDSWYSKVGDDWVPNFETVEYYVHGEYVEKKWDDDLNTFKKVYTNGPEWTDSLTLLLWEGSFNGDDKCVLATVPPIIGFDDSSYLLFPGNAYQFDWNVGTMIEFMDITSSNATAIFPPGTFDFGTIDEIKEGDFGGVGPLSYADVNGVRFIQGIGVTTWKDGECLFGPVGPYQAQAFFQEDSQEDRHYRSMLVHFERNGEVLYDVWPEKDTTTGIMSISKQNAPINTLYDIQGVRITQPKKGIYIQNGKKLVIK